MPARWPKVFVKGDVLVVHSRAARKSYNIAFVRVSTSICIAAALYNDKRSYKRATVFVVHSTACRNYSLDISLSSIFETILPFVGRFSYRFLQCQSISFDCQGLSVHLMESRHIFSSIFVPACEYRISRCNVHRCLSRALQNYLRLHVC